jgi:cytosine/uracil/thiamine/allantoin permease
MKEHDAKTLCTIVIWIATALIFIFGVFKFNWNGVLAGLLWMMVAAALAAAATKATEAIWKSPIPPEKPKTPPTEPTI